MMERVDRNGMQVASSLAAFIEAEALPGTGVEADTFWQAFADVVAEFSPQNKTLLDERESLQNQIDDWHRARVGQPHDAEAYQAFLREIGYLVPEGLQILPSTSTMSTRRLQPSPGHNWWFRSPMRALR